MKTTIFYIAIIAAVFMAGYVALDKDSRAWCIDNQERLSGDDLEACLPVILENKNIERK